MTAKQLQQLYGKIPVFRTWARVDRQYITRTDAKKQGIKISKEAKPDAIKNGASTMGKDRHFLLYDITKFNP